MAVHNLIITSGTCTWQAASFDSGVLPATGDTVNILSGTADITLGTAQSAVTLAALNFGGSFSGTVDELAIGATLITCNCGSGKIKLNAGSVNFTLIAQATGVSKEANLQSLRIRGGNTASKVYVTGNASVGIATTVGGQTATINEYDVTAGTLVGGAGVTWVNGYQSGGNVTMNSGGTLFQQSETTPVAILGGTGAIATVNLTGKVSYNVRPASGDAITTALNVGPGATIDFSSDPRPLTLTNPPVLSKGCFFTAFNPTQVKLAGPASLQVKTYLCGLQDVTIDIGEPVLATLTNY